MTDIKQAMLDPTSVYHCPDDVLNDKDLNVADKIKILLRWEYDARELEVAEEEGMTGGPPDLLSNILTALHKLNQHHDTDHTPPTKQAGGK